MIVIRIAPNRRPPPHPLDAQQRSVKYKARSRWDGRSRVRGLRSFFSLGYLWEKARLGVMVCSGGCFYVGQAAMGKHNVDVVSVRL